MRRVDAASGVFQLGTRSQGLVTFAGLAAAGVSEGGLSRAVAAGSVVRVRPKVYAAAPLPARPRFVVTASGPAPAYVAHVRAALLSLGDRATACRRTAAALHGWGMLVEPSKVIELAVDHGRSRVCAKDVRVVQRRRCQRVSRVVLDEADPLWVTTPVQTCVDCALDLPLLQAVVVCDSALRAGDVTIDELVAAAGRLRGVRDARKMRRVLELCDPKSGSVLESVLRVRLLLGGILGFETQRVLRDLPGQHLRVDFCFREAGLVVEADGAQWHQDPTRDQERDNAMARLGWRVLRFTWAEVVHDTERVLADVREALACGGPSFHLQADEGMTAA